MARAGQYGSLYAHSLEEGGEEGRRVIAVSSPERQRHPREAYRVHRTRRTEQFSNG